MILPNGLSVFGGVVVNEQRSLRTGPISGEKYCTAHKLLVHQPAGTADVSRCCLSALAGWNPSEGRTANSPRHRRFPLSTFSRDERREALSLQQFRFRFDAKWLQMRPRFKVT